MTIIPVFSQSNAENVGSDIPPWVKNNAEWWSQGLIDDSDFISGIEFLIQNDIMQISTVSSSISSGGDKEIPSWIRNNADWWSQGLISDDDFVKGIQYLVEHGIIQIPQILQDFEYFDFNLVTEGIDLVEVNASPFLTTYGVRGDYVDKDGERTYDKFLFELKEEHQELYEQLKNTDQKTIVVFPIFTATAYDEPGFYTYYRGVCDASCLTAESRPGHEDHVPQHLHQVARLTPQTGAHVRAREAAERGIGPPRAPSWGVGRSPT